MCLGAWSEQDYLVHDPSDAVHTVHNKRTPKISHSRNECVKLFFLSFGEFFPNGCFNFDNGHEDIKSIIFTKLFTNMLMIYFGVKIVICIKINAYEGFAHENSNIDVEKNIFNFLGRLNN